MPWCIWLHDVQAPTLAPVVRATAGAPGSRNDCGWMQSRGGRDGHRGFGLAADHEPLHEAGRLDGRPPHGGGYRRERTDHRELIELVLLLGKVTLHELRRTLLQVPDLHVGRKAPRLHVLLQALLGLLVIHTEDLPFLLRELRPFGLVQFLHLLLLIVGKLLGRCLGYLVGSLL